MKKRGQVTIFIALGIILVVALILVIAFRGNIAEVITQQTTGAKTGFSAQVDEVRSHVQNCLEKSLQEAYPILATRKVSDYDSELATEVEIRVGQCADLTSFTDVYVRKLGSPKVEAFRDSSNTQITATLTFPLSVEKGDNVERLESFSAEESLVKPICVLKEKLDSNCRATEEVIAGGFIFEPGEEVKIGGECLEC